jgi:Xaa-Pro aminopeptidase
METRKLDCVLIYGDEKHHENVRYFTGFDPRFESALVVVALGREPIVITGVENQAVFSFTGHLGRSITFSPFSLQGLVEAETSQLKQVLRGAGVRQRDRVGLCGERFFTHEQYLRPETHHFVPHFVWEAVVATVGDAELVVNTTDILTHPVSGLRARKSAWELAVLELANVRAAAGIKAMLAVISAGMTEEEVLAEGLRAGGIGTFGFQPTVVSGKRSQSSLLSATAKRLREGEPVSLHYGPSIEGYCGNVSRSGLLGGAADLVPSHEWVRLHQTLADTYGALVTAIKVGAEGGQVYLAVKAALQKAAAFGDFNAAHLTGMTEWEDTIARDGSEDRFASGHVIQADLHVRRGPSEPVPVRMQDAYALADQQLRAELRALAPEASQRIHGRRRVILDANISIDKTVLPLSDLAPFTWPFLQDHDYRLSPQL